jgi:uncharacterized protein YsxB (DUF464 family)
VIHVRVHRSADGRVTGFEAEGHAGFAPRGRDIVCAGVSALCETAALALAERLGVPAEVHRRRGYLSCWLPQGLEPELAARAQDVLETMVLGVRAIERAWPRHVRVEGGEAG